MAKRSFIYIEYKYPNKPWIEYDRTIWPKYAKGQVELCKQEHPYAEIRIRKEPK